MKHLKMYESYRTQDDLINLPPEDISKSGESVFMFNEGDGYKCTLLDRIDSMRFSRVANKIAESGDDFYISSTNTPGIAYCLGSAGGDIEFKGPDFASESSNYEWCISAGSGELMEPEGMGSDLNSEDYLFTLKKGYVTTFNAHGQIDSIPIGEYIEYLKTWDSYAQN